MSINRTILEKLKEKTEDDKNLRDFISSLLQKESEGIGQYKTPYRVELEKYCKSGETK